MIPASAQAVAAAFERPAEKHVTPIPEEQGRKMKDVWASNMEMRRIQEDGKLLKEKSDNQYYVHVWDGATYEVSFAQQCLRQILRL